MTIARFATLAAALVLATAAHAHDTKPNAARDNSNRFGSMDNMMHGQDMTGRDGHGSGMMDDCPMMQGGSGQCPMMQGQDGMMGQGMMGDMTGRRPNAQWRRPGDAPAR